ncbi:DUF2512 family protein [Ornithinibacillus californiensis]|uniref:DUF2512 family protein n=1 Tax=Ornithinibacillus californiensis TaxID=161536 RepID=UPI00064E0ECB|nr:DUF2512 family protein [Ornithinibacillus californiensis]
MMGLIVKLIVCPLTVFLASVIFPNVNYTVFYQPIIVGFILAISAHMMEVVLLKEGRFWISTIVDFIAAALIVYVVSLFQDATVTVLGAILTGILLTITELVQHQWLIRSGRNQKT